ncbi:MAG TPA: alpha/beta hydrolase [Phenylobacterium sp.]
MSVLARQMPPVQSAQVNGVELAYYEVGPREGVPIILCHGFPETAFSWRRQLEALESAGRWAIAPDQRGYGLSSRPPNVDDYDMEQLTADLVGLLDHLGVEKAIFVGHDWGGIVVWQLPLMYPDRCAGIIGLNTPFSPRYQIDPIELFRKLYGEDMYIVWFQKPGEADALLGQDVEKTMRFFMRRPAAIQRDAAPKEGGSTFAFGELLQRYDPAACQSQFLSPDELAAYVEMFQRSGFTGPINWYRNFTRNWQRSADLPQRIDGIPCLMVTAEKDAVLRPALAERMGESISDLESVLIEDCGHWTQQEKPDEVNRIILDWLDRRFPR